MAIVEPPAGEHGNEGRVGGRFGIEPRGVIPDFDENLLDGVLGLGVVAEVAPNQRTDAAAVALNAVVHGRELTRGNPSRGQTEGTKAPLMFGAKKWGTPLGDPPFAKRGNPTYFGRMTESITWITPLKQTMSVAVTVASSMRTLPSSTRILTEDPWTVLASESLTTSAAITRPGTTW